MCWIANRIQFQEAWSLRGILKWPWIHFQALIQLGPLQALSYLKYQNFISFCLVSFPNLKIISKTACSDRKLFKDYLKLPSGLSGQLGWNYYQKNLHYFGDTIKKVICLFAPETDNMSCLRFIFSSSFIHYLWLMLLQLAFVSVKVLDLSVTHTDVLVIIWRSICIHIYFFIWKAVVLFNFFAFVFRMFVSALFNWHNFFNCLADVRGISNRKHVQEGHEQVLQALLDYTLTSYPQIQVRSSADCLVLSASWNPTWSPSSAFGHGSVGFWMEPGEMGGGFDVHDLQDLQDMTWQLWYTGHTRQTTRTYSWHTIKMGSLPTFFQNVDIFGPLWWSVMSIYLLKKYKG